MIKDMQSITTEQKIGSITYVVTSAPCVNATETIKTKVEKLILKEINRGNFDMEINSSKNHVEFAK